MSKKPNGLTAKDKRLLRKERQKQVSIAWEVIQKANAITNPLEKFTAFREYKCRNGLKVSLASSPVTELDPKLFDEIFSLERDNMRALYEECEWGWHDKKKREEMADDRARYLVATNAETGDLLAFSHYRFDLDFDIEVLYCYELQLKYSARRQGLGKFMMQILELIAFSNSMRKVVLTVLKGNREAMDFFTSLNYELDDTSPLDDAFETYSYVILSKKNKRLPDPQ